MSEMRTAVEEYLTLRRSLGFKLREHQAVLHDFVYFLEQQGASYITNRLALDWARQPQNVNPAYWARRLSIVRGLARYRSATDPRTEIPPQGLIPHRYHRRPPYIYSDDEIGRLIEAAKQLHSPMGLRASSYSTLLGLLAVTGIRITESIALNCEDVNLKQGVLTVGPTKFGKSRLIPIHQTTQEVLRRYAGLRNQIFPQPKTPSFFVSDRGTRLTHWTVRSTFVQLSRQIGLRGPKDSHGPRLHDLRHRFAIRTLLTWYQTGLDVERHLPELSTYLGHTHVTDTYWYLSATSELLRLAAQRLECRKGEQLS